MSLLGVVFGAEIGLDHSGIAPDRVGRASRENAAVAQHDDRRRDLEDDVHVVLDEHDRDLLPLPKLMDLVDHPPALFGPHAGGGLVEQQHLRIEHQRERDIEQLLVAMRQRRRDPVALAGKTKYLHRMFGTVAGFGEREAPMQQAGTALIGADRRQHRFMHGKRWEKYSLPERRGRCRDARSRAATAPPYQRRQAGCGQCRASARP